ncbi:NADPH-dependent FMN reductase [Brevibacillus ginsengisoli]|uniref:NADPH-dependent FMN reductase n=1 Tax=Brevibacillus ginsengisoli TaxID=363854 RepID=UPI003CF2B867
MKILVINGSATLQSRTRGLSTFISNELSNHQVEVLSFDAGIHLLPIYNGTNESYSHPEVARLIQLAEQANGFFITTPEYHNSMTGALKNALDFLGGKQFKNKPVALAAVCGGGKGGINALNSLRTVVRGVYGLALPSQFVADPQCFNEQAEFVAKDGQERVASLVTELVELTRLTCPKVVV